MTAARDSRWKHAGAALLLLGWACDRHAPSVGAPLADAREDPIADAPAAAVAAPGTAAHVALRTVAAWSDARMAEKIRERCEETAARAVTGLPQVKRAILDAQHSADESGGDAHYGSVMPIEDDDGFTVELGVHTTDRFEWSVSYSVDRSGHLAVTVRDGDVQVPPESLRIVERSCKR